MSPMLVSKFGPLGTDLDQMTLKFRHREPVVKNSKWPTIWNLVILKIFNIFRNVISRCLIPSTTRWIQEITTYSKTCDEGTLRQYPYITGNPWTPVLLYYILTINKQDNSFDEQYFIFLRPPIYAESISIRWQWVIYTMRIQMNINNMQHKHAISYTNIHVPGTAEVSVNEWM